MKILIIDPELALPFALECMRAGHQIKYWQPKFMGGHRCSIGDGMVPKVRDWEPHVRWADLIVVTGNAKYAYDLEPYFLKGFPVIGANQRSAALELDREVGMEFLEGCGVPLPHYEIFDNIDKAETFVRKTKGVYACKQWGSNDDKSMSYVSSSPADMIFTLERWKKLGKVKGKFMLQEKVKGVEMGVGGWFGRGGFCSYIEENFEHKKFMNGDLGCNTGEMGTVMRYVQKSKLFNDVLAPCAERLHGLGYVGSIDINCIIDKEGTAWPLEFTCRFGYPAINLNMALHEGDPAEWLLGLLDGRDLLRCRSDVCVGVVMSHGEFPKKMTPGEEESAGGYPIRGITAARSKNVWLTAAKLEEALQMKGGEIVKEPAVVTAGNYVAVITGLGPTVKTAAEACYADVKRVKWDSNVMYRTDIGAKLEEQLPLLHSLGFAKGMYYD